MWLFSGLHIVAWPLLLARLVPSRRIPPWAMRMCLWVLHGCIAAIVCYTITDLFRPFLNEWVENGVVATSRYWASGGNVYPAPDVLAKFGIYPYGPLLFQLIGTLSSLLGGSNLALKAAAAILALLVYTWLFWVLRRHGTTTPISAVTVELLAVVVGIMGVMIKADIVLIALAALACGLASSRPQRFATGVTLAVIAGLAAAIKIHGALYILPAAIEVLARRPAHRLREAAIGCGMAACIAIAPFLVPRTSLSGFIYVHRVALQDGLLPGVFISNIAFIAICVFTVHSMTPAHLRDAAHRRMMLSVLVAGAVVSVFAAKSTAGPHHLIPFLPYLCLPLARALTAGAPKGGYAVLLALFLVSFQPITSIGKDTMLMAAHWYEMKTVL